MVYYVERKGYPRVTQRMIAVLTTLRDYKQDGWSWVHLPEVHGLTINALVRHGLVIYSDGLDGRRYQITAFGAQALRHYLTPVARRDDGLCPICGQAPRKVTMGGNKLAYCRDCYTRQQRIWSLRRVWAGDRDR